MPDRPKPREVLICAALFLDLVGFGMLLPDVQLRAEKLGLAGWMIGAILASTFVVQFLVSPRWGRASDKFGRKRVLVLCSALSASGLLCYGVAHVPLLIVASRLLSGLGGGNVAIAQAYISDSTGIDSRTVALGRLGAAVSAGLIVGPALLAAVPKGFPVDIGFVAGSLSALGALMLALFLPGAKAASATVEKKFSLGFGLLREVPQVAPIVAVAVVAWFSLALLEGTFGRLIERTLGLGRAEYGAIFAFESVVGVVTQGLLLNYFARRFRDPVLLRIGFVLQGCGLLVMPLAPHLAYLFVAGGIYSLGAGLANGTINGLCSRLTPAEKQGELFGLLQGARSIGFVIGPIAGGAIFDRLPAAPYVLAGGVSVVAAVATRVPKGENDG
jgi:MFS family permease